MSNSTGLGAAADAGIQVNEDEAPAVAPDGSAQLRAELEAELASAESAVETAKRHLADAEAAVEEALTKLEGI